MFHIYGLYHIYLYIRSAFYVFSVRRGGGGSELRFSVLLHHGHFFVFSVMTSISSVETPVDRRRFLFSSVLVAYQASYRTNAPSSSHSSITSSYLDIYLYISMYIQAEYRRLCVIIFVLLFTVPVISFFLRLRVAEEFLFISARRRAYHL